MKIRHSFVTNSSSSSFVAIGIEFSDDISKRMFETSDYTDKDEFEDALRNEELEDGLEVIGGNEILGITIAYGDDACSSTSLPKLEEFISKVREAFDKYNITEEIKLISGTVYT